MKPSTLNDLLSLGFKKKISKYIDDYGKKKEHEYYELKGKVNDSIYFNPKEKVYKFYYKTILGDTANHVHLSINNIPQLITILQVFQFKFTF